jgi:NIMA (never in mitosis gene a)-related kinase
MDSYLVLRQIGAGNFGSVFLVEETAPAARAAAAAAAAAAAPPQWVIKKIALFGLTEKEEFQARAEATLLKQLSHPNIVHYHDAFIQDGHLHIVMEYCEGGDLGTLIKRARERGERFSEAQILDWFAQLCDAVSYVHGRHVLHRDLKTQNVFLARDGSVRLGDFGIARVLDKTQGMASTVVGTPYYMSPEVCKNKPYARGSDVWALGCVLYELCALDHAFEASNLLGLVVKIVQVRTAGGGVGWGERG